MRCLIVDFLSAVDDSSLGLEDKGAGHIGERGFGAGLFHLHLCIDRELLQDNLSGHAALTAQALDGLLHAATKVAPTGMQNSFGSRAHARASDLLAEKGDQPPRSLVQAFLKHVKPYGERDRLALAVEALYPRRDNFDKVCGPAKHCHFDVAKGEGSLAEVIVFVKARAMQFLLFQLQAPLAAWGDVAVGQYRGSRDAPGNAALVGLLGAALGLLRSDEPAHAALRDGYRFALGTLATGQLLRGYHTAQVPGRRDLKDRPHRTRRDELSVPKHQLNTILSTSDYRQNAAWAVAVQALPGAPHSLDALAQALREPRCVLYLGRWRRCRPPRAPEHAAQGPADPPPWLAVWRPHRTPGAADRRGGGLLTMHFSLLTPAPGHERDEAHEWTRGAYAEHQWLWRIPAIGR